MSKIDFIKNISIYQDFSATTDFYQKLNINNQPDECIIRSISYSGPTTDSSGGYLIWSDMINDFIGSFAVDSSTYGGTKTSHNVNISPQINIHFKYPINFSNNMRFVLYGVVNGNPMIITPVGGLTGEFTMNIDFITYKK
jgi:hypothetical protein